MTPPIKSHFGNDIQIRRPQEAEDVVADLTEKESQLLLDALNKKMGTKESKEKMKTPQLESENHKIDTGLSKKEKLAQGWKEEERPAFIDGTFVKIKVLKKELAPDAFVREYQDDGKMPKHLIGEQLFNWKAVLNLKLQDRLPTYAQYQEMGFGGEKHKDAMGKNFKKGEDLLLSGYRDLYNKRFDGIGKRADCRLADGNDVVLGKDEMGRGNCLPEFGFSLRLLKN